DRPGNRRRLGIDSVGVRRYHVAARRCDVAHGDDNGLFPMGQLDLSLDLFARLHHATWTIDSQPDGTNERRFACRFDGARNALTTRYMDKERHIMTLARHDISVDINDGNVRSRPARRTCRCRWWIRDRDASSIDLFERIFELILIFES